MNRYKHRVNTENPINKEDMDMKFYVCSHCKNMVMMVKNNGPKIMCCGQPMDELIPNTSDGAFEKHVPDVEVKDGKVYVTVGSTVHPMLENHYITFIALETEKGGQIHYLTPQDEPKAVFDLNGEKPVAVYEYCNLHGFWKKEL